MLWRRQGERDGYLVRGGTSALCLFLRNTDVLATLCFPKPLREEGAEGSLGDSWWLGSGTDRWIPSSCCSVLNSSKELEETQTQPTAVCPLIFYGQLPTEKQKVYVTAQIEASDSAPSRKLQDLLLGADEVLNDKEEESKA